MRNWLFRTESLAGRFRNRYLKAVLRRLDKGQLVLPERAADWPGICAQLRRKDWVTICRAIRALL